jgi:hypothetical protein
MLSSISSSDYFWLCIEARIHFCKTPPKIGPYIAKCQTHTYGWLDIDHYCFGFEVLCRVEDLHQDWRPHLKRCGNLQVAPGRA